jgi:hypothetical protein
LQQDSAIPFLHAPFHSGFDTTPLRNEASSGEGWFLLYFTQADAGLFEFLPGDPAECRKIG